MKTRLTSYLKVVLLTVPALLIAVAVNRFMWFEKQGMLGEWMIETGVILLLVSFGPVRRYLDKLPRLHLYLITGLIFLCLTIQLTARSRATFPLVTWAMFSQTVYGGEGYSYRQEGISENGDRIVIVPAAVFPSLRHGRLTNRMEILGRRAYPEEGASLRQGRDLSPAAHPLKKAASFVRNVLWDEVDEMDSMTARKEAHAILKSMGEEYNRNHPENSVQRMELVRRKVSLHSPEKNPESEILESVTLL